MQRYFVDKESINFESNIVTISSSDVHHIKDVMRMSVGDKVIVCVVNKSFLCRIINISNNVLLEIIEEIKENNELDCKVTIAHGLVRRDKLEEVVRRLVELGCNTYQSVYLARSVVKKMELNLDRLNKIVKEASEQSNRNELMKVNSPITFKQLLNLMKEYDLVLLAHTINKENVNLMNELKKYKYQNILVIIGPEGGFDNNEVDKLIDNGAKMVSLGKRILRTETAPLYIMSVLGFLGENNED